MLKPPPKPHRLEVAEEALKSLPAEYSDVSKVKYDVEAAFELFIQFTGDYARTAAALNVPPAVIVEMAEEFGWHARLKELFELKRSGKPGDLERALNRALNFVIANQYRNVLQRLVRHFHQLGSEGLLKELTVIKCDKDGNEVTRSFNAKAVSDLAAAIQKMTDCTYAALNDSLGERTRRNERGENEIPIGSIHQVISQSIADSQNSAKREEFSAKLAEAQKALDT